MKKSRDFSRNIHSRDWYLKRGIYVGVGLDMGESGEGVPPVTCTCITVVLYPPTVIWEVSIDQGFVFYIIHLFCCLLFA